MSIFNTLASAESTENTIKNLISNGFMAEVVENKSEALEKIKEYIPAGASIHNGASVTLDQIGYIDYLKSGAHSWKNLHADILAETDPAKQAELRHKSVFSDFYLGSAHAISETGEIVIASNTGSQLPHLVYTSPNIILVASTQKITPTLADAIKRLEEYVVPLEDKRSLEAYGANTMQAKTLIMHKENSYLGRKVRIIFVNELLGY